MRPTTIDCPRCGSTHEYTLRDTDDRHLRRCPDCDGWFVLSEMGNERRLEVLDDGAACPVADCEETIDADVLAQHIIAVHGASLNPVSPDKD